MTNWTNITNAGQLLNIPNDNSSGSFWAVTVYLIWVVLMITFSAINIEVALLGATFIALVSSIFLTYAGLVAWENTLFFVGFLIFTILYVIWSSNKDQ
jgi:hypothetical protein|tara:strand:+ start:4934 stop:5227 length:294 start_codon:yes stop_codon:yes gene_type:complete